MGLYNMIFGKNPASNDLLALLGFTQDSFYRFRDCYLSEYSEQTCIAVYTRAGAGNSECWCDDWIHEPDRTPTLKKDKSGIEHDEQCVVLVNETMEDHPLFICREDDDFDYTYCTYYFRVPQEAELENMNIEPDRNSMWLAFLNGLSKDE